jgi:hypothetical protein
VYKTIYKAIDALQKKMVYELGIGLGLAGLMDALR